ncbi:uncharacterized protein LOC110703046 [Chenopodium quinoa]|uniref:uncharacterized protein LOC110703046 n=1 Tax=Chenopodium quinoa TaxID=63459 RepID=UPI000B778BDE|nr:uncharacterized protein LOC110703046 [Chenopodium quinoa]XP_021736494.1 uncharacterized protein LOC110703046 [Chenopodium quinoa]XP_021736495.1 uncharacterized protein LOC110703046 [Chenopodium quinoa]XP_021736496.1 uncharacterized protein LOC110703046 [Chenopodium quinoa]
MMYVYSKGERIVEENVTEYLLEDRVWIIPEGKRQEVITDRRRLLRVLFNSVTKEVSCECRKFETFGILCKHGIGVLDQNLVFYIPSKYVLDRWRKDVPRKHTRVKVAYHDPSERDQVRQYYKLMHEFEPICEVASSINDPETVAMVISCLQQLSVNVKKSRQVFLEKQAKLPTLPTSGVPPSEKGSNQVLKCNGGEAPSSVVKASSIAPPVKDPIPRKKPRGRPKVTHYKSLAETGYKTQQKKPTQTKPTQQKTSQTQSKRRRSQRLMELDEANDKEMVEDFDADIDNCFYGSDHSMEF